MNNDRIIIAKIKDKLEQCRNGSYVTATGFLNSHEQALAMLVLREYSDILHFFNGGYDEAERRQLICVPAYYGDIDIRDYIKLSVLRIEIPKGSRELTHRDYLGSILSLGLERSVIGDILVRSEDYQVKAEAQAIEKNNAPVGAGADIIVSSEIEGFLLSEYSHIGRTEAKLSIVGLDSILIPELRKQIIKDTIPSLRLDNVIATAFKLSRSNALTAIRNGLVSVNHIEQTKPDARVEEGNVLVLRGKGKAILSEIGERSKKDRIWIQIARYL